MSIYIIISVINVLENKGSIKKFEHFIINSFGLQNLRIRHDLQFYKFIFNSTTIRYY